MKILVLGAPGAGKTKFAKSMGRKRKIKVLDSLPQKFIDKTGLALGGFSDYRADFIFTSEVLTLEYKNEDNDYIITAGPLYAYAHFLTKATVNNKDDKVLEFLWIMMTMSRSALDSLWYDEIYYLPLKDAEPDSFEFIIDASIANAIKEFRLKEKVTVVE